MLEVIHHQHAVEAVQQKCAGPIPPAALKSPEIAEGRAAPAIEAALHGEHAVQFRGGEGNRDAPEKRDEGEEHERHARAGIVEDAFVAERAAGGVAVEDSEQRKETDLAQARAVGGSWVARDQRKLLGIALLSQVGCRVRHDMGVPGGFQ